MKLNAKFDVPWGWREAMFVYMASWIGLPILLVLLLRFVGVFKLVSALAHGVAKGEITSAFVFLLINGVAALLLVRYFLKKHKVGWDKVGWRPFNLFKAALLILIGLGVFLVAAHLIFILIAHLFPHFNASQPQVNDFTTGAKASPKLSLIALVLIPPIIEETVFRGFIFPAISDQFGMITGVIGSSLLFAVAHLQLNVSVYTFVLGCLLAMMYAKTRSIWPGIFLHMLNNYLAYTVILGK